MCILFLEYRPEAAGNSPYVLVAANNRDELYERETAPAGYWSDYPNILAGRPTALLLAAGLANR